MADPSLSSGDPPSIPSTAIAAVSRRYQHYLDKTTQHVRRRWAGFGVLVAAFVVRIAVIQGFYLVSYSLAIFALSRFLAFLSPQIDPETEDQGELPLRSSDEFRPFVRRLPEFKFWYALTKGFVVAFILTFFSVFDVPVFWPILLFYWFLLFTFTMKRQILHMIKYKYVPFTIGAKQRYNRKKETVSEEDASLSES